MKWRDAKQYEQHKKSKCQSCSKIIFLIIILILSTGCSKPKWSDVFQVKLIDKNVLFSQYLEGTISEWDLKYDYDIYEITNTMLMYGKEASNRKQEIDRQHYTIPNQRPKDKHCGKI